MGYLVNMLPTVMVGEGDAVERAGLDMYFLQQDGNTFKATILHEPYFYIGVKPGHLKVCAPSCVACAQCLSLCGLLFAVMWNGCSLLWQWRWCMGGTAVFLCVVAGLVVCGCVFPIIPMIL